MTEELAKGSDGFEPPKYLASLIASVNDGAKAAQGGALFFALIGVYLLATAFSASDEDLLRGRTVTISQIGATLPVSFSFAIAPFVFIFLHIYTLVRYDMLAANVRQFLAELRHTVLWEVDRERCRQLLANVEFIQALIAPAGSRQYSPVWRCLVWGVVALFPVVVLLLVQINALRYQSELITRVQQFGLLLDLSALVWFFHRAPLDASAPPRQSRLAETTRWAKVLWLPAIVMGLNLVYMNVVSADADVRLVRYKGQPKATWAYFTGALSQPIDVVLCRLRLNWGCRYLRVDHRTLVEHVWDEKVMADLRRSNADQAKLAAIEGLVLRDRSLRFAVLDESSLFAADLIGADLRQASLRNARLSGAKLYGSETQLQGADLDGAQLQGADLHGAQLQGADLAAAELERANLVVAQLWGANLLAAELRAANLSGAELRGANLFSAQLQGANLKETGLQGTNMRFAQLTIADLTRAQLQGADLSHAHLQGADLREARLWRAGFLIPAELGLTDLRGADFKTPLTGDEVRALHAAVDAILDPDLKVAAQRRLGRLLATDEPADQLRFTASAEVLVSDPKNPLFADIPTDWLIMSPTPAYTSAFVALLADELASGDPVIAGEIALRAANEIQASNTDDWRRSLYTAVTCRLLANAVAKKVKLEQPSIDRLSSTLRLAKIECEPAKPTALH